MSVETGIDPRTLLELDAETFDAIVRAVDRRWTPERELLASLLEVEHSALLAYARVHSRKGARLPKPISVPRPGDDETKRAPRVKRITPTELARLADAETIDVGQESDG